MRVYADVNRIPDAPPEPVSTIIQVGPTPPVGTSTPINGKFVVDIPDGVVVPPVTDTTCLINSASPDYLPWSIYSGLRDSFPAYQNVIFNQLLTSVDMAALDLVATFPFDPGPPARFWPSRCQVGRDVPPAGVAPGSVALLPENPYSSPPHPGLLITSTIDISLITGGAGAKEFVVYWKVYGMSDTADVMNYTSGSNSPTLKNLVEIPQDTIECFISVNGGGGYTPVSRLSPCVTCGPGTLVKLAFVNHTSSKVFLTAYAVMF